MKTTKWITVSSTGTARLTAKKPKVSFNEVAMQLEIVVPDSVFKKPVFKATLTVTDGMVPDIGKIDVEAMTEAIHEATGFEVRVVAQEAPCENDS